MSIVVEHILGAVLGGVIGGVIVRFTPPFVKSAKASPEGDPILLDPSALSDPRLFDLAASGLLDKRLLLPRFIVKEAGEQEERVIKKLEALPELSLRYEKTDFPDVKELCEKTLRLARLLNAPILSAEMNRIQSKGVRIINIHTLSSALKPMMQRGECLKIKIQRQGREERQGVGYLEDGTMIVVNGGGDFIGKMIDVFVLSVKQTAAGRMIFCNVVEERYDDAALT